jgi:hypothetical protein
VVGSTIKKRTGGGGRGWREEGKQDGTRERRRGRYGVKYEAAAIGQAEGEERTASKQWLQRQPPLMLAVDVSRCLQGLTAGLPGASPPNRHGMPMVRSSLVDGMALVCLLRTSQLGSASERPRTIYPLCGDARTSSRYGKVPCIGATHAGVVLVGDRNVKEAVAVVYGGRMEREGIGRVLTQVVNLKLVAYRISFGSKHDAAVYLYAFTQVYMAPPTKYSEFLQTQRYQR